MVWNKTLPQGTTPIKNSDQMIRDNWEAIENGLVPYDRIRLDQQAADPANIADTVLTYSKEVDGVTRLFCEEEDGTVVQLSHGGAIPLDEVTADPTNSVDRGFVYTKEVAGNSELFYEDEAGNVLQMTTAGAVKVPAQVQVVSAFKTDTFTGSATSFTDVPDLSVTITPSSATNKILIIGSVSVSRSTTASRIYFVIDKAGTNINVGDAAGNRSRVTAGAYSAVATQMNTIPIVGFDSPASTAPQTYKIRYQVDSGPMYINRTESDSNSASYGRAVSSIIALEVLA